MKYFLLVRLLEFSEWKVNILILFYLLLLPLSLPPPHFPTQTYHSVSAQFLIILWSQLQDH